MCCRLGPVHARAPVPSLDYAPRCLPDVKLTLCRGKCHTCVLFCPLLGLSCRMRNLTNLSPRNATACKQNPSVTSFLLLVFFHTSIHPLSIALHFPSIHSRLARILCSLDPPTLRAIVIQHTQPCQGRKRAFACTAISHSTVVLQEINMFLWCVACIMNLSSEKKKKKHLITSSSFVSM